MFLLSTCSGTRSCATNVIKLIPKTRQVNIKVYSFGEIWDFKAQRGEFHFIFTRKNFHFNYRESADLNKLDSKTFLVPL